MLLFRSPWCESIAETKSSDFVDSFRSQKFSLCHSLFLLRHPKSFPSERTCLSLSVLLSVSLLFHIISLAHRCQVASSSSSGCESLFVAPVSLPVVKKGEREREKERRAREEREKEGERETEKERRAREEREEREREREK